MTHVNLQPGEAAYYQGKKVIIRKIVSLKQIMVQIQGGQPIVVDRKELVPDLHPEEVEREHNESILGASQKAWDEATRKHKIIESALKDLGNGQVVQQIAVGHQINPATIYRWIEKFNQAGSIEGLLEGRGIKNLGKKKLNDEVEEIITQSINDIYLKAGERKSIQSVIEDVETKCRKLKYVFPHPNSIRKRINEIDEELAEKRRKGKKKSDEKYGEKSRHFSEGERAYSFVQLDHTPLDIILVDPIFREPIGTPWLTTGIDIKTRFCLGYYLGFDAPSRMSAGQCVANMLIPKDHLLQELGIVGDWPAWGAPARIGVDNASEFRSKSFERSCIKYQIHINWRRRGMPRDGGYIESFNKTLENEIHNLPGSKFSNVEMRDGYESEKKAVMTFLEFEKWLVTFIVNKYHHKKHSTLGTSPYEALQNEIVGTETTPPVGWRKPPDSERVTIDFLPEEFRTIQDYGVSINNIKYYEPALKSWINRTGSLTGKTKIKHEFRWDPRNLKSIFFFDPELNYYLKIAYAELSHPDVNIWEWRAILKHLKLKGEKNIDENRRFAGIEEMRRIEEEATRETEKVKAEKKKARRQNSQRNKPTITKKDTDILTAIDVNTLKSFL